MMQGAALKHKPSFMLQFYSDKSSVISLYRHICLHSEGEFRKPNVWSITKADGTASTMQVNHSKTWLTKICEIQNRRWAHNQNYFAAGEQQWPAL